jgi:hypothetical protein
MGVTTMRRNMDLIRKMLLAIEEHPTGWAPELKIDGYESDEIGYHAYLIVEAGLAVGHDMTHSGHKGPYYMITRLTSAGHDFADGARNQFIWDEVSEEIQKKGLVSITIDVMKRMLDKFIRRRIELD